MRGLAPGASSPGGQLPGRHAHHTQVHTHTHARAPCDTLPTAPQDCHSEPAWLRAAYLLFADVDGALSADDIRRAAVAMYSAYEPDPSKQLNK